MRRKKGSSEFLQDRFGLSFCVHRMGRRRWITYHLGWDLGVATRPPASSHAQSSKLIHSRPFHWGQVWEEVDEMKRLFICFLLSFFLLWSMSRLIDYITWITCSCVMHDCGRAPLSQNTKSKPTKGFAREAEGGIGADVGRSGGKILCTLVPPMLQGNPTWAFFFGCQVLFRFKTSLKLENIDKNQLLHVCRYIYAIFRLFWNWKALDAHKVESTTPIKFQLFVTL